MSEEHVKRKIDGLRQDPRYTQVLRLGRLPPAALPPAAPQQEQQQPPQLPASAPSPEPSPSTSAGSPEENSRCAAEQKVLDAMLRVSKKVHGEEPPLMPGLRGVDISFNQRYGFQTMEASSTLLTMGPAMEDLCLFLHSSVELAYFTPLGGASHAPGNLLTLT